MKKEFRRFCKKKPFNRYYYSKKIQKLLYNELKKHKNILLYIPLNTEVDINPLIKKLRRENKNIYVPFMEDLSFKMVKYSLPLKKKKFSIFEPQNKRKTLQKIEIALVPVIGIDKSFRRVGFGKGMYDRFFAALPYRPKIVFTQLRPCISGDIVTDDYDIRGDLLISFKTRRKNEYNNRFSGFFFSRSRGFYYRKKDG
ncbi:MAG: 5-formyltetrahydrofolate cyclo-ligase [Epsilonproteobacteria bacterium]|nr:5-formyltetrahydrofolate cyclo-ligase [Campylobacterota bacterium]